MSLRCVENLTGFNHFSFIKLGADNRLHDVVAVKVDLQLENGELRVLEPPAEIHLADRYSNEADPYAGAVDVAGDAVVFKPGTDIFVTGHALAPGGQAETEWLCELGVETRRNRMQQRLHLHGPRYWQWSFTRGWHLSATEPAGKIPLSYTLAYGGRNADRQTAFDANPAGVGWYEGTHLDRDARYAAPRIHYMDDPVRAMDRPLRVAGYAPLARWCSSRYRHAGTYDARWQAQFDASPHSVYPDDFDARFFQCAHPDWIHMPYLRGDERFWLAGFHAGHGVRAQLPGLRIHGQCLTRSGKLLSAPLPLDTLHIDLDRQTVSLTWRASLPQSLGIPLLLLHGERLAAAS